MRKMMVRLALLAIVGSTLFASGCFFRSARLYRTPRMVVDTVRVGRCVGRRWTYFCHRGGMRHLKVQKIRCWRYSRRVVRRRRWFVYDRRCRHHAYLDEARPRRRYYRRRRPGYEEP